MGTAKKSYQVGLNLTAGEGKRLSDLIMPLRNYLERWTDSAAARQCLRYVFQEIDAGRLKIERLGTATWEESENSARASPADGDSPRKERAAR